MKVIPKNKKLKAIEKALADFIVTKFNKYKKEFIDLAETLNYNTKSVSEEIINLIVKSIGNEIISEVNKQSLKTFQEQQIDIENQLELELNFTIKNKQAEQYITERQATLIKINTTTQNKIQQLLLQVVRTDITLSEMVTKINQSVFLNRKRAELIATNELGNAFVQGNQRTMKTLALENGFKYLKKWDSVNDSNVTRGCRHNDNLGWVGENYDYPNIDGLGGGEQPPRFIGCRCTLVYDTNN